MSEPQPPAGHASAGDRQERRTGTDRRRSVVDRRSGLERRRGPGRRRSDWRRSAEEGELNDEQFEFVMAIEEYKRLNNKPFPTWTEVLEVVRFLGYRKVAAVGAHVNEAGREASAPTGLSAGPTEASPGPPGT
jgi:hypothetical protein